MKFKEIKILYNLKLKIRKPKQFLKYIIYLFYIKTPFKYIIMNINSHFKSFNEHNFEYDNKFKFKFEDWITGKKLRIFIKFFKSNPNYHAGIKDVLGIGSYEGRSAVFFLTFFNLNSIYCVDTWQGSIEQSGTKNFSHVETNFDYNLSFFKNKLKKIKKNSDSFFLSNESVFDMIFIDGYHEYNQVLRDLNNAKSVLKKGGFLLLDDYDYRGKERPLKQNVASAVNHFILENKNHYEVMYIYQQVLLKKI